MERVLIYIKINKDIPYAMLEILNKLRDALERIQIDRLIEDFGIQFPDTGIWVITFSEE